MCIWGGRGGCLEKGGGRGDGVRGGVGFDKANVCVGYAEMCVWGTLKCVCGVC